MKLGIRLKQLPVRLAHLGGGAIEVFDIETGAALSGLVAADIHYRIDGPIEATLKVIVAAVEVSE
jgi:hypothetical protein